MGVNAHELPLPLHIRDHVVDRDLRRGTGSRRDRDDGNAGLSGGSGAFQASHILKFRVCDDDADGLCGIHGGTAADGDDVICTGLLECRDTVLHILNGGIGLDVRVDLICQALPVKDIRHLARHMELDQIRVGTHKCLLERASFHFLCDLRDRAGAMIRGPIQIDPVCHVKYIPFCAVFFWVCYYINKVF